jgi:hypothetical protein
VALVEELAPLAVAVAVAVAVAPSRWEAAAKGFAWVAAGVPLPPREAGQAASPKAASVRRKGWRKQALAEPVRLAAVARQAVKERLRRVGSP